MDGQPLDALAPSNEEEMGVYCTRLRTCAKKLNVLLDSTCTPAAKRDAMNSIYSEVIEPAAHAESPDAAVAALKELGPYLCRMFNERVDSCRERAVSGLTLLLSRVPNINAYVPTTIPAVTRFYESKSVNCTSEQVRCNVLRLLALLMERMGSSIGLIASDCVNVLERSVTDACPEVAQLSCELICVLAHRANSEIYSDVTLLLTRVIKCTNSRRSTIRLAGIRAICTLMLVNCEDFSTVKEHLCRLAADTVPAVRAAVHELAATWLIGLRDRHSYAGEILYFYLLGLGDEIENVRDAARSRMDAIALQYERDWPQRVKELLDFAAPNERVGFGVLVRDSVMKVAEKASSDISSWLYEFRNCGVTAFHALLGYASNFVTGYLDNLVPHLSRMLIDDDTRLREKSSQCFIALGQSIELKVVLDILVPQMMRRESQIATKFLFSRTGITGSEINRVLVALYENETHLSNMNEPRDLYLCILRRSGDAAESVDLDLLLRIGIQLIDSSSFALSVNSPPLQLLAKTNEMFGKIYKREENHLNPHSESVKIFEQLCKWCPDAMKQLLSGDSVLEFFKSVPNSNPGLQLSLLKSLALRKQQVGCPFATRLCEFLIPLISWRPGKIEFELREIACHLAQHCVNNAGALNDDNEDAEKIAPKYINAVASCIEDMRDGQLRCQLLCSIRVILASLASQLDNETLCDRLIPETLARLNDSKDNVRIASCEVLEQVVANLRDAKFSAAEVAVDDVVKKIVDATVIHADDDNPTVREAAKSVISGAFRFRVEIVRKAVGAVHQRATYKQVLEPFL